jgi:ferredoxin-type protein NapG
MASDPEYGRRRFLKESVSSIARTAQEFVAHRDAPSDNAKPVPVRTDWLRPPGAVAEALFMERCTRCGDCLKVCPYGSITTHPNDGYPVLFADVSPCWLCSDLPCIEACETDALQPLASLQAINMGLAKVNHRDCTASQGCHACVSRCPTQALAMDFNSLRLDVIVDRCVGCGLCEQTCKTVNDRVAIRVIPARMITKD